MGRVLIEKGHLIDPKNSVNQKINLLIENGKIIALTQEKPDADLVIDASGKVVCPGFIDIHMHEDPYNVQLDQLDKSIALSMVRMGVTTAIGGNCGDNICEPDVYLDMLDRKGTATNIGLLAGHTFLRNMCGGTDKYGPISDSILEDMIKKGKQYLNAGCFGLSFGVKYVPGTTKKEMVELSKLCKAKDLLIASHVRYDVNRVIEAVQEMAELGKELGLRIQISHIGSMGGYGQMKELLNNIRRYREEGIDIKCDCYPYNAFSTGIGETTYDDGFLESYHAGYDSILICDGKYSGQRCTKELFDELRRTAPETMTVGYFMKEDDVNMALLDPEIMIASDGVRNGAQGHPRAAGTFPRFLCEYVKKGKINLEEAIGKMTALPSERLHLPNKGNLAMNADGDVVIFDYEKIQDLATYEEPAKAPKGIDYVLIGGDLAVSKGEVINDRLGSAVRSHSYQGKRT